MSNVRPNDYLASGAHFPVSDLTKRELDRRWIEAQTNEAMEKARKILEAGLDAEPLHASTGKNTPDERRDAVPHG